MYTQYCIVEKQASEKDIGFDLFDGYGFDYGFSCYIKEVYSSKELAEETLNRSTDKDKLKIVKITVVVENNK